MRPVGGYFELEINRLGKGYHPDAVKLNTGRNAFEHILRHKKYEHVYIPYFTCDVMLEPLKRLSTTYSFYHIDHAFYPLLPDLTKGEAILYTNYFGIMNHQIRELSNRYENVIIDNAQAFYEMPWKQLPTFYSPRKFFGLPDGGIAYNAGEKDTAEYPVDISGERISHLIARLEKGPEAGFSQYQQHEEALNGQPVRRMSELTKTLMRGIDYESVKLKRLANFHFLHEKLKGLNTLSPLIGKAIFECPMVYPFFAPLNSEKRKKLIEQRFYIARYWPNVLDWCSSTDIEYSFVADILPLPVDQRYGQSELNEMVKILLY
jgi:hypothetical protein